MRDPVILEVTFGEGAAALRHVMFLERSYIDDIRMIERAHRSERERFFLQRNVRGPLRSVAALYNRSGARIRFARDRPIGMVLDVPHNRKPIEIIDEFVVDSDAP